MPIFIDNKNNLITYDSIEDLYVILQDGDHNIELSSWNYDSPYLDANLMQQLIDQYVRSDLTIGTTTTLAAGANASVTNIGTSRAPILNFGIPQGVVGPQGDTGELTLGTTTIVNPDINPSVTNTGTPTNGIFNFNLPRAATITFDTTPVVVINPNLDPDISVVDINGDKELQLSLPRSRDISLNQTPVLVVNADVDPSVSITTDGSGDKSLQFSLPKTAEILLNEIPVNVLNPNENPYITDSGVDGNMVLQFGLPSAPNVSVGNVITGSAGTNAIINNTGTNGNIVLDFTIPRGDKGETGQGFIIGAIFNSVAELLAGSVNEGEFGLVAGTLPTDHLDYGKLYLYKEASWAYQTDLSVQGIVGPKGDAATISVGVVSTGLPGSNVSIINTGNNSNAIFDFSVPRGDKGDAATITVGTTTTSDAGTNASVLNSGNSSNAIFDFTIPKGAAATINVGTTTTGIPGSNASVSNSGDTTDAVLNFTIPQGVQGESGTITLGTVSTGEPGTNVIITNTGNSSNAIFNFTIPEGIQGIQGITGAPFTILGYYDTIETLISAHPTGLAGDVWAIGLTDPYILYIWDTVDLEWSSLGPITVTPASVNITYDNTVSLLTATNIQDAIDEIDNRVDNLSVNASDIIIVDSGTYFTDSNVEDVLQEVGFTLNNKADTATTLSGYGITDAYTKTTIDTSLSLKADLATTIAGYGITDAYTKTTIDEALTLKADTATTIAGYGITDAYTKTTIDSALALKANNATTLAGYGITDAYTETEIDTNFADVLYMDNVSVIADLIQMNGTYVSITDTGNYYTSTQVEGALQEVGTELNSLDNRISNLVIASGGTDQEVIDARGGFATLGSRLSESETKIGSLNYSEQNYITSGNSLTTNIDIIDQQLFDNTTLINGIDNSIGNRIYTEHNYITSGTSLTSSLDILDQKVYDNTVSISNINIGVGNRSYTEQNYITSGTALTVSLDSLDQQLFSNTEAITDTNNIIGTRIYTEQNFITNSENITVSLNKLDIELQDVNDIITDAILLNDGILNNNLSMVGDLIISNGTQSTEISTISNGVQLNNTAYGGEYRIPRIYVQTSNIAPGTMQDGDLIFVYTE